MAWSLLITLGTLSQLNVTVDNRRGCEMKCLFNLTSKLAAKINTLIREEERAHPDMLEMAAMVYVGDVYVLREQCQPLKNDGWGAHCYTCGASNHL